MVLMKILLACTVELMNCGGGDVHLLHNTLTPSVGRHPSRAIVQPCCCGYALIS
jgi:hypothetical protein